MSRLGSFDSRQWGAGDTEWGWKEQEQSARVPPFAPGVANRLVTGPANYPRERFYKYSVGDSTQGLGRSLNHRRIVT